MQPDTPENQDTGHDLPEVEVPAPAAPEEVIEVPVTPEPVDAAVQPTPQAAETRTEPSLADALVAGTEAEAAPAEQDMAELKVESVSTRRPDPVASTTVTMSKEMTRPVNETEAKQFEYNHTYLTTLDLSASAFAKLAAELPNQKIARNKHTLAWAHELQEGAKILAHSTTDLEEAFGREGSDWQQGGLHNGVLLDAGRPVNSGLRSTGRKLQGDVAKQVLKAKLGIGTPGQFPMWHSGLWLSYRAPMEDQILELETKLGMAKVELGRISGGAMYSAYSVSSVMDAVNFALSYVYEATTKDISLSSLKEKLKITDINLVIHGMASIINPAGYPLARPCTNDVSKCQHIEHEILQLSRMNIVDRDRLSKEQLAHMARRTEKVTDAELAAYSNAHGYAETALVKVDENVYVELEVPSIALYEKVGLSWVNGIAERADAALGENLEEGDRDNFIMVQATGSRAREFAHWVKRIIIKDGEEKVPGQLTYDPEVDMSIEDREDIDANLGDFSAKPEVLEAFVTGVKKFISSVTIAAVVIKRHNCRVCGVEQTDEINFHPRVVALDAARLFFILLGQRAFKQTIGLARKV